VSIPVGLEELDGVLDAYPWGYLVTVGDDGRAHTLAVPTDWRDDALQLTIGRSTRANAAARPGVTMMFPPDDGFGFSLIVDGTLTVDGDTAVFTPSHAVLHRPALYDEDDADGV
jgi:hypothetical protein